MIHKAGEERSIRDGGMIMERTLPKLKVPIVQIQGETLIIMIEKGHDWKDEKRNNSGQLE